MSVDLAKFPHEVFLGFNYFSLDPDELIDFCDSEAIEGDYQRGLLSFHFELESDAVVFKLRWS